MRLHHPISLEDLVEAWILDRLPALPTGDGDRPSVRFLAGAAGAADEALRLQDAADPTIAGGAVLSFERAWLATAARLVGVGDDPRAASEARSRADVRGIRANVALIALGDEALDAQRAAWASGHPRDDGSGRLSKAALAAIDDLLLDPRRLPPDLAPLPFGR